MSCPACILPSFISDCNTLKAVLKPSASVTVGALSPILFNTWAKAEPPNSK